MKRGSLVAGFSLLALALGLGGCVQKPADDVADPKDGGAASAGSNQPATDSKSSGKESSSALVVPRDLKHEGFEYFGLENPEPVVMSVTGGPQGPVTNTQTIKLESVKPGEAVFLVQSDQMPDAMEYTVKKEGVYGRQVVEGLTTEPQLQLPADPKPGTTWPTSEHGQVQGQDLVVVTTNKIVGLVDVKTKKGEMSALLVSAEGTMTFGKVKSTITSKTWLVKGLGAVRSELTKRTPGEKKPVQLISEIQ